MLVLFLCSLETWESRAVSSSSVIFVGNGSVRHISQSTLKGNYELICGVAFRLDQDK